MSIKTVYWPVPKRQSSKPHMYIYMYIHTYIHTKALNNTHKPHTHTFSSVCMYIYIHMTYIDRAIKINKQIYIYIG